jgi:hypothetical protein
MRVFVHAPQEYRGLHHRSCLLGSSRRTEHVMTAAEVTSTRAEPIDNPQGTTPSPPGFPAATVQHRKTITPVLTTLGMVVLAG